MIALRALGGVQAGHVFLVLPPGPLRIGRDPAAEIALFDRSVSRRHARIDLLDAGYVLVDEESQRGTSVNGRRITSEQVRAGDEIALGDARFAVESLSPPRSLEGRRIGGYTVLEHVGAGGMGTVYRAEQRSLERVVALKVLPPQLAADASFAARFIREATAAGELAHPDILRVYDVDLLDGTLFYAMEFMAGGTVADLLRRRGRLSVGEALAIAASAARAIAYAEEHRIVHRDVKPANLLVDARGQVKLGDLGLAQLRTRDEEAIGDASAKAPAGICGSPGYMAPEQVLGRPVDHRADLFALGATLYELLAGEPPFRGDDLRSVLRAHLESTPAPLHEVRTDVPREVSALCERLLAKDPDARPSTAIEVAAQLDALAGESANGARDSAADDAVAETARSPSSPSFSHGLRDLRGAARPMAIALAVLAGLSAGLLLALLW